MMHKTRPVTSKKGSQRKELQAAKLDELIAEATVDAYDESEQTAGFCTMIEEHLDTVHDVYARSGPGPNRSSLRPR